MVNWDYLSDERWSVAEEGIANRGYAGGIVAYADSRKMAHYRRRRRDVEIEMFSYKGSR